MLEADANLWAEKAITRFCPEAHSPMSEEYEIQMYGFQHVKDSGYCGEKLKENILSQGVTGAEQCAALASGAGKQSFLLGAFFRRGWCIGGTMEVNVDQYKEWSSQESKKDPKCTLGEGWKSSMLFDFYAVEPVGMKDEGN